MVMWQKRKGGYLVMKLRKFFPSRLRAQLFSTIVVPARPIASLMFEWAVGILDRHLIKKNGVGLSLSLRPLSDEVEYRNSDFGIAVHGKIVDVNFLHASLIRLRKMCPDSPIILSTYRDDLTRETRGLCEMQKIHVIECPELEQLPPPFHANFARSVASAYYGINAIQKMGATWALKLRVDQEITQINGVKFVESLLEGKILSGVRNERIIGTSYNSLKNLPLFLSDMLQFGEVEVLLKYWEIFEPKEFEIITQLIYSGADDVLLSLNTHPEVWLSSRYMRAMDQSLHNSEHSNLIFWSEFAGVVDAGCLGQNWVKSLDAFDSNYESLKWLEYPLGLKNLELRFSDWAVLALSSTSGIEE